MTAEYVFESFVGNYGELDTMYFTLYESDGSTPVDLTGYTIKIYPERNGIYLFEGACEEVDFTNGQFKYVPQDGDFSTAGTYNILIRFTKSGVDSFKNAGKLILTERPSQQ